MKKLYLALLAIMLFSVITTVICICILPESVPADFLLDGTISRFGSKYEYLMIPFFAVLFGLIALISKVLEETYQKAVKRIMWIAIVLDGMFTAYGFLTLLNIVILECSGK